MREHRRQNHYYSILFYSMRCKMNATSANNNNKYLFDKYKELNKNNIIIINELSLIKEILYS